MPEPENSNTHVEVEYPHRAWIDGHALGSSFALSLGTYESFLSRYKVRGEEAIFTVYAHMNRVQVQKLYDRLGKFLRTGE
jgi:hypothetical protein